MQRDADAENDEMQLFCLAWEEISQGPMSVISLFRTSHPYL
jgi:hypothetical protein